jgi:hypothetical protein
MNMLKSVFVTMTKCLVAVTPAALLIAALAPPAHARSQGAFAGSPLDNSSSSCFAETAGGIQGTGAAGCVGTPFASSPRWEVALPVESTGTFTVTFGIRGNGATGPSCTAFVSNQLSSTLASSATTTNATTSYVAKAVSAPSVPGGGFLYAACDTFPNSAFRVGSINWTQP